MMHTIVLTSVLFFLIIGSTLINARFPKNPKPCPYGDSECIEKIIDYVLKEKADGYAPLNIVSLNPLKISEIHLKQSKDNPVFIDLTFKNSEIYGLKGAKVTEVKGFGKDITLPHQFVINSKSMSLIGDYTIQGKVLILPISGTGKSNLTMSDVKLTLELTAEPLLKDGKTYMHVKKVKLSVDTSRLYFDFKNLYNGDKTLGDSTNSFLNENWRDIFVEVRKTMTQSFANVFGKVINNVFENYPYEELFAKE